MTKIKRIKIMALTMGLLVCMLAIGVFAGVDTETIRDNVDSSVILGSVYINVKPSTIYAETTASYPSYSSSDYVLIAATGCPGVTNVGSNYTTAWTQGTGSFSSGIADGSIRRGIYSGSNSAWAAA